MKHSILLKNMIPNGKTTTVQQLAVFALLNLGVLESLSNGALSATDAISSFFHAENCAFAHSELHDTNADEIMSRGVQLADLFDVLPPLEAQREFQRELVAMRRLSLALLEEKQLAA